MKKILFIWDRLDSLGGVEMVMYNLSKKLQTRSFKIFLVAFKDGYLRQIFKEVGVNVTVFERKTKLDFALFQKLYCFIKKKNIDIVHTHGHFPGIIGRLVGKLLKKKLFLPIIWLWMKMGTLL